MELTLYGSKIVSVDRAIGGRDEAMALFFHKPRIHPPQQVSEGGSQDIETVESHSEDFWVVITPQSSFFDAKDDGEQVLKWNLGTTQKESTPEEVWALADSESHGFKFKQQDEQ